ncbi:MAG: hypothetical protein WAU01_16705 [Saprospiraceae bacterium]
MKKLVFALLLGASFSLMSFTVAPEWIITDDGKVTDDGDYCGVWVCGNTCTYVMFE